MADHLDPDKAITLWEAFKFLGPLVGTGGITAIVVAWLGSRRPTEHHDQDVNKASSLGIQALLADHLVMDRFVNELRRVADVGEDLVKLGNRYCDLVDIDRAVERLARSGFQKKTPE